MGRKQRLPTEEDVLSQLKVIDDFNIGSFGKGAGFKRASTFQAPKLKKATKRPFGTRAAKTLRKSKELL